MTPDHVEGVAVGIFIAISTEVLYSKTPVYGFVFLAACAVAIALLRQLDRKGN